MNAKFYISILIITAILLGSFPANMVLAVGQTFEVSQVVEETTPTPSPTPSGASGGSGGSLILELLYFIVEPGTTDAFIRLGTNLSVKATLSWGLTPNYELGSVNSSDYFKDHVMKIENLIPDTTYYFKIELLDEFGRRRFIDNQEFRTLSSRAFPENVTNLTATANDKTITLSWKNPNSPFESIRIVRSETFYPIDPFDGSVVFEGMFENFVDANVVHDTKYYYAVFTKSADGRFSSGAITSAKLLRPGERPAIQDLFAGILELPLALIHPLLKKFSLSDIDFIQDGKKLPIISDTVEIKAEKNLTISIDYEKMPEVLKTIAITMYDPEDSSKTFSFLLRVNKDKTAYEAHIAPLERAGKYKFGVAILDHKNQGLRKLSGVILSTLPDLAYGRGDNILDNFLNSPLYLLILLFFLIILAILWFVLRRKRSSVVTNQ